MSVNNVSHKELLTFSNLTNLDWHFVDLEAIKELQNDSIAGEVSSKDSYSTKLKDLLTPGLFYRVYDNGEIEYCYGSVGKGKFVESHGLIEMWQAAGIAMEYLEK